MNNLSLSLKSWWYRNTHFEFFGMKRMYIPVLIYALWKSIKIGTLNWISYINPRIYKSGLFEHSKYELLKQLPEQYNIPSLFVKEGTDINQLEDNLLKKNLNFPLVVKPDRLYRGIGIYKVNNLEELRKKYNSEFDVLIQEYAQYPNEYAVFYVRFPNESHGKVVSLIEKDFMCLSGDGSSTLMKLITRDPRARLYLKKLKNFFSQDELDSIPQKNEIIPAGFIGSHNKGTVFINKLSQITPKMSEKFDTLTKHIPDFYYGRYDVKADSFKDLEAGNFEILELNAAVGEPVHMYDPKTTILEGYSVLLGFWSMMAKIARQNKKRGVIPIKKPE